MTCELPDTIAIDGPAASGKTTVGMAIARKYGYHFLDTGLMYRAFAVAAMRAHVEPTDEACARFAEEVDLRVGNEREAHIYLGDEDVTSHLHDRQVERNVSAFARLAPVRAKLRQQQREFARRGKAVLAGRDIGEVVLPDAALKIYLDADEEARARRRNAERGIVHETTARESQAELSMRDRLDSPQTYVAPDAVIINTNVLTLEEVLARVMELVSCDTE
ncbi:MAG: (d)CMP kinase [Dehalococcoidia bacterium]